MHGKYQRRIQHAEREHIPNHRQRIADVWEPYAPPYGYTLTVPVPLTITITTISVSTSSTSSSSSVATSSSTPATVVYSSSQYSSSQYTSSQYTSSQYTPSSQTESLSSTSSSSSILLPSVIPLSSTPSPFPQGNTTVPQGSVKLSVPPLSSGGIAGIVLACLILLLIVLFFSLRRRFQRNRLRFRGLWTKNIGDPYLMPANSYEPKSHSSMTFRRSESNGSSDQRFTETLTGDIFVRIPPPPTAYNNIHDEGRTSPYGGVSTSSISNLSLDGGGGGGDNMTASNVPMYYSPGSANSSPPADATVVFTFITTLPDELSIRVGETIRVLEEYDDGWALCMNTNGQQGMVPMECLNRRRSAAPSTMSDENWSRLPDARGVRRASSLDPSPALKAYRS